MKNKIINLLFIISVLCCKGQENTQTLKNDTMIEHFDIKHISDFNKFKKLNKESDIYYKNEKYDYTYYYEYNDKEVEIRTIDEISEGDIIKIVSFIGSPYEDTFIFYPNGNLKAVYHDFYIFGIGVTKKYDEKGKVIEEINNDLPYKFSIDDVRKKIKAEYKIDIVTDYKGKNPLRIFVNRWFYTEGEGPSKKDVPMYQVRFWREDLDKRQYIDINATTGATISQELDDGGFE